ncbi:BNLF2a [macacine gammaherpesvirus 10]|uniref:BNLF2a n=1 Tax=macacine gammaherpesvirus 10 TaxID=2560569 RepID=A0A0S0DIK7_9GAMA|nr:BNLF2a [macacine gammaherpesvirus 10]ALF03280.1 BNLF2a [macacine gammaherpesvirus 10]
MVFIVNQALLEQQTSAYGLPGSPEKNQPVHRCPASREINDLRIGLVVLAVLFGILCLLLI